LNASTLSHLKTATCHVAKEAGLFIRSQLHRLNVDDVAVKDLNSLVSYVDIESEKRIVAGLRRLLPGAGFITEEETTAQSADSNSPQWVIDPLDGTTNFIHRLPFFAVSIALKLDDHYILGVVYDIMNDQMYSAARGQGAFMNDKLISVSPASELSETLLATGFPYNTFESMDFYLAMFRDLFPKTRGVRRCGSAALDLCYVAKGSFAGFFEFGLNEWDIAAGICLVSEAGGHVSDFQGESKMVQSKTILATNSMVHGELLTLLQSHL
jgi:myo-inositol-1(or 4)-monophosphatase